MLSLEPGRFQRRQRPLDQPVAQGHAGWSRGASGRQRPPPGISGTALWAPFGAWGPDVDEPHCQPSGALATALPPGQEVASAWDPAHICPCSLRPQHAAS